jgi:serine/threonine-protein kinase
MKITNVFLLPKDVELVSIKSLSKEKRRQFVADDDDFALTRMRGRSHSKVIDSSMARLVKSFSGGKTIVDAVLEFSRDGGHDPEATLEAAYPILEELIQANFLAEEGSGEAAPVEASLKDGDEWTGLTIKRAVQVLEDSEIYQATTREGALTALKLARQGGSMERLARMISREAKILEHLDGSLSPKLLAHGDFEGRPYLATSWCEGVSGARAAARFRSIPGNEGRRRILALCCDIAEAYAGLHEKGVLHGDIHPGNLIIGDDGVVTIIDFGLARTSSGEDAGLSRARRGGLGFFYEPEFAAASIQELAKPPLSSFSGEQHILAHLIYQLITSHGYAEFSAEREASMRQLAASEPEPFERWSIAPWPDVERTLRRALEKNPADRFESVRKFADALRESQIPEAAVEAARSVAITKSEFSGDLLQDYLRRLDPAGALFESGLPGPPYSSVNFGSAGVACFLYRIASIRNDAQTLSWAKLWLEKSIVEIHSRGEMAFTHPEGQITREIIGTIALYHTETGIQALKALIGHAMGDIPSEMDGLAGFVAAAQKSCENIDLTLGSSGVLLGCALLDEALPERPDIRGLGDSLMKHIWARIEAMPTITSEKQFRFTGIAHGWAGVLYAVLMWCRMTKSALPGTLPDRLDQLANLAESAGAGVQWERKVRTTSRRDPNDFSPSWCNGTGGMIHLWTLAHQMLGERRFLDLAEGSAWHVIDAKDSINQFCCGLPGQTYGILNLFKHTGENRWLNHAREMTMRCLRLSTLPSGPEVPPYYFGLYKGPIGTALLSADIDSPSDACLPMFESEGWRRVSGGS